MEEKPKTRPGRNGGTLKNDAGPGRPKGKKNLTTILAGELSKNSWKKAHMLVDAVIMQAARGNGTAIKLIWDHTVGPVTERIESSGVTKVIIERVQIADSSPSLGATGDIEAEEEI